MTQPTPPPPEGGSKQAYFALQDPDDTEPYAVAALNADGMPERFVPGKGFIDWPALSGALFGFDAEAAREVTPITEEQANALTAKNIGALPDFYVAANQGSKEGNSQAEPLEADDDTGTGTGTAPSPAPTGGTVETTTAVKDALAGLHLG